MCRSQSHSSRFSTCPASSSGFVVHAGALQRVSDVSSGFQRVCGACMRTPSGFQTCPAGSSGFWRTHAQPSGFQTCPAGSSGFLGARIRTPAGFTRFQRVPAGLLRTQSHSSGFATFPAGSSGFAVHAVALQRVSDMYSVFQRVFGARRRTPAGFRFQVPNGRRFVSWSSRCQI